MSRKYLLNKLVLQRQYMDLGRAGADSLASPVNGLTGDKKI